MEGILGTIIASSITAGLGLIGVIFTNKTNKDKIINDIDKKNTAMISEVKTEMRVNQAVTNTKIEDLTKEVEKHNGFAQRMPKIEEKLENMNEKINFFHKV